jgi:penicillin amidase
MYTHYGPIVYDQTFPVDTTAQVPRNYAMKWVAHEASLELLTFYYLNRANNYRDYVNALGYYRSPAQNFVFASASNDIGLWVQGAFPAKWREQGRFLLDGSRPEQEWRAFIPTDHNPQVLNPDRGFVSSANQVPVDTTYPYYVYDHSYEHFRNRRINQQLAKARRATAETMMELQNDVYNQKAADVLPQMLDSLDLADLEPSEKDMYDLLRKWNLKNSVNQVAPTIFNVWWSTFYHLVWDEFDSDEILLEAPDHAHTIKLMQQNPNDTIFDSKATTAEETLNDLLMESFRETGRKLASWQETNEKEYKWGDYKATSVQHMLQIPEFSVMNVAVGGGRNIVSANSSRHGASWKMIVELGPELKAWGVYPGGQSGNPGSHYYTNLLSTWAKGQYYPIQFYSDGTDRSPTIMLRQIINPLSP